MTFFTKLVAIAAVILSVTAAPVTLQSRACANYPSSVDPEMRDRIYKVAISMKVSDNVMMAMMCTALTESDCNNLNCGDKDSLGIFQQRPSIGVWGTADQILNPEFAARSFLNVAIPLDHGQDPGDLAQAVQNAEAGNRYTMNEGRARELINQAKASVGGGAPAAAPAPKPTSAAPKPKPTTDAPAPKPTSAAPKPDPTTDFKPTSSAPAEASSAPGDGAVNVAGAPTIGASPASSTETSTTLEDGEECTAEYTPVPGDTCLGVAAKFNIDLNDFYKWNPCIDSECQNLQVTFPYCVGVASSGAPSS